MYIYSQDKSDSSDKRKSSSGSKSSDGQAGILEGSLYDDFETVDTAMKEKVKRAIGLETDRQIDRHRNIT